MLGATLMTATTWRFSRASALTLSRSSWSMIAISPGFRRLVSDLVLRSRRAGATRPGRSAEPFPSLLCNLREYTHIALPSVPDRLRCDAIDNLSATRRNRGSSRCRRISALGRGRGKQLTGVRPAEFGVLKSRQHSGQFFDPAWLVQLGHAA